MNISDIKNRFGITGHDPQLESVINTAVQIASTDLTVLVKGESGVGKETIPKIIHNMSPRKHNAYVAINCGAIPEGTIDSELFGHVKGSFTGATESRKGYFEEADGGTIFLDEVGELPLSTQVRLLRVLENGEFIKVGSSKIQKIDVRVIAASNINFEKAISQGKFREDLYYRLNIVPINIPPLRERKGDIHLLFRKFASDFSDKYKMAPITLDPYAKEELEKYRWPGNIRQLRNIVEQISILEINRLISAETLMKYLPIDRGDTLPVVQSRTSASQEGQPGNSDLLHMLMILNNQIKEMREELDTLKSTMPSSGKIASTDTGLPINIGTQLEGIITDTEPERVIGDESIDINKSEEDDSLSISELINSAIDKALKKYPKNTKAAAKELGISERTLYRWKKQMNK